MVDSLDPVLPPEIEEMIFSFAAAADLKVAAKLCLVTRRVHQWVIPYIYEIMISDPSSQNTPHSKISLEHVLQHGQHVRHLLLQHPPILEHSLDVYISSCPGLVSLGLWFTPDRDDVKLLEVLLRLQVKNLSCDLTSLRGLATDQGLASSFRFPSVTHLEFLFSGVIDAPKLKEDFPALTHLAIFSFGPKHIASTVKDILAMFGDQIKVVTWYHWRGIGEEMPESGVIPAPSGEIMFDDPRIVEVVYGMRFVKTWLEGVKGGLGVWRVAEEVIAARYGGAKSVRGQ